MPDPTPTRAERVEAAASLVVRAITEYPERRMWNDMSPVDTDRLFALRDALASPPDPQPQTYTSTARMSPVLYWLDDGKFARAMLVGPNMLVVDLTTGDGPSVVGKPEWFDAGYVAAYGGLVPECCDEGTEPGQWSYGVANLPTNQQQQTGALRELLHQLRRDVVSAVIDKGSAPDAEADVSTWFYWLFSALDVALKKADASLGGLLAAPAPAEPQKLESTTGLFASHRCKVCGAMWRKHDDGSWSLASSTCGKCCDNVPMGDQIEPAPAEPEPVRRTITGDCTHVDPPGLTWDDIEPEPVADAERERRVAEWVRRITAARFNNDTPAFDRAVLDAVAMLRDRDAERERRIGEWRKKAYSPSGDEVVWLDSLVEEATELMRGAPQQPSSIDQWTDGWSESMDLANKRGKTAIVENLRREAVAIMRDRDAEVARLRAELTRLSGQSGSCAECERLTKERDAGWEALERLRERMMTRNDHGNRVLRGYSQGDIIVSRWVVNEIDAALAARPARGKEGA